MTDTQSAEQAHDRIRILCDLRRYDEAVTLARRTVATGPDDAIAWCLLAKALFGVDDANAALDAAHRATSLTPDDEWPHRLRSIALSELGRHNDALAGALESVRVSLFCGKRTQEWPPRRPPSR